jgi:hypothetical protein
MPLGRLCWRRRRSHIGIVVVDSVPPSTTHALPSLVALGILSLRIGGGWCGEIVVTVTPAIVLKGDELVFSTFSLAACSSVAVFLRTMSQVTGIVVLKTS